MIVQAHTRLRRATSDLTALVLENDAALRLMGRLGFTLEGDQPVMVHGEACVDRVFVLPRRTGWATRTN